MSVTRSLRLRVLHGGATDYSHISNFQLESLILAQNERWRQA
ncbi:unnamed protein product [Brucella canis str. Oliveri]|nr:hypothetical protein BRA1117 [Brucella suis 1330]CDL78631.1 unnamed protein product [Brucella canis str. Oliveri]